MKFKSKKNSFIPYGTQSVNKQDIQHVVSALRSLWLTQGPRTQLFEEDFGKYCGSPYAVAVASGTAGLHLACLALDLGPRDILWTSPNTFVASANCALYCGATVDFVDINLKTFNMCTDALEEKLITAEKL